MILENMTRRQAELFSSFLNEMGIKAYSDFPYKEIRNPDPYPDWTIKVENPSDKARAEEIVRSMRKG